MAAIVTNVRRYVALPPASGWHEFLPSWCDVGSVIILQYSRVSKNHDTGGETPATAGAGRTAAT